MNNQAYQDGYADAVNGRMTPWHYVGNPSYQKGALAGSLELCRPKRVWWWPF